MRRVASRYRVLAFLLLLVCDLIDGSEPGTGVRTAGLAGFHATVPISSSVSCDAEYMCARGTPAEAPVTAVGAVAPRSVVPAPHPRPLAGYTDVLFHPPRPLPAA